MLFLELDLAVKVVFLLVCSADVFIESSIFCACIFGLLLRSQKALVFNLLGAVDAVDAVNDVQNFNLAGGGHSFEWKLIGKRCGCGGKEDMHCVLVLMGQGIK